MKDQYVVLSVLIIFWAGAHSAPFKCFEELSNVPENEPQSTIRRCGYDVRFCH